MKASFRCATLCAALAVLTSSSVLAQDATYTTPEQKAGYSIGATIGGNLASQGLTNDLDVPALVQGVQDAISGQLKMAPADMEMAIQAFQALQQQRYNAQMEVQAQAGRDFLTENAAKAGVTTTASGLQYEVVSRGAGGTMPAATDTVSVHYTGTLIDGTVFDSSVERDEPATFPLNGVIPGWTEGLQLMSVGDKFRFYIPSALAYGETGAPPVIPPSATLIFDVELLSIEAAGE